MDIEELALNYLSGPLVVTAATKRSRKALMGMYERLREKYLFEKKALEHIVEEANELKKLYERHKAKHDKYFSEMEKIRTKIYKMDEDGVEHVDIDKKEKEEPAKE